MIRITVEVPEEHTELVVKLALALKEAGVHVMIGTQATEDKGKRNGNVASGNEEIAGTLIAYAPQKPGKKGELALVQLATGEVKNVAVFDQAFNVGEKVIIYKKPSGYSGLKKADPIPF